MLVRNLLLLLLPATACALHFPSRIPSRTRIPRMGGPSGLPRMPIKAWPLTKKWNPSLEYNLEIATLWRDLEITLGTYDSPNEDLAFRAAKKCPSLLDPSQSSRWVFFRSKDLLVKELGSERAAIQLLAKDPVLMLAPRYDGLNPKLESMLSPDTLRSASSPTQGPANLPLLLGGVTLAVLAALAATQQL